MAFLITLDNEEEKPLEITDRAEIIAHYDVEADEALFELGFEPPSSLIFYLEFQESPFETILELLNRHSSLLYMVKCIEHVWPLVEEYFPDEIDNALEAVRVTRLSATEPQNVIETYITNTDGVPVVLTDRLWGFVKIVEKSKRKVRTKRPKGEHVKRTVSRHQPWFAHAFLADAFRMMLLRTISLFRIMKVETRRLVLWNGVLGYQEDAYQVSENCRRAVKAAGGSFDDEMNWQVVEVFRVAMGRQKKRSFDIEVPYESAAGEYHGIRCVGTLEEV